MRATLSVSARPLTTCADGNQAAESQFTNEYGCGTHIFLHLLQPYVLPSTHLESSAMRALQALFGQASFTMLAREPKHAGEL